jgi:hypothetical protein
MYRVLYTHRCSAVRIVDSHLTERILCEAKYLLWRNHRHYMQPAQVVQGVVWTVGTR